MTTEEIEAAAAPATTGAVAKAQWSINLTTLVSTGGALGTLIVCMLTGGWYFLREARAEGREGARQENASLVPRVTLLEAQLPFVVVEVREQRTEFRAFAERGSWAAELKRPMAPLPALDGGQ